MSQDWITIRHPRPEARIRLYCLPHAGAGASVFLAWGKTAPDWLEVCSVQLPGRENRHGETLYSDFAALIAAFGPVLACHVDQPYVLFGHSMGALLAFELSRWMQSGQWRTPSLLVVSAYRAPNRPPRDRSTANLPDDEFLASVAALNGTPAQLLKDPRLRRLLLPVLRADYAVCESYVFEPVPLLDCPVSVYGGINDTDISRVDLEAWSALTSASTSVQLFWGDHFFIRSAQERVLAVVFAQVAGQTGN